MKESGFCPSHPRPHVPSRRRGAWPWHQGYYRRSGVGSFRYGSDQDHPACYRCACPIPCPQRCGFLYSIVQMPGGVPVATMAIGEAGATNAALTALRILSIEDQTIAAQLADFAKEQEKLRRR